MPGVLTGPVTIAENEIDMTAPDPTKTMAQGILVGWTTGVDAHIARNRVSNASRNSIEAIQNYQGVGGTGRVRVEANTIATPSLGLPWPGPQTPNGIVVGFPFDPAAAVDPRRNIRYELQKNVIEARGRTSIGIVVSSDGAAIKDNEVSTGGTDAQAIVVASSNGEVVGNVLRGSGRNAIRVAASRNRLEGNDLRQYEASDAQAYLAQGSGNNVCTGNHALTKVVDLGSGNRCP